MTQRFIPLEKQSKRNRREHYTKRRGSWGGVNPVTRKPPNPCAYKRERLKVNEDMSQFDSQ